MTNTNVFVECFSDKLNPYLTPIADKETVMEALNDVEDLYNLYTEKLLEGKIKQDWLEALFEDFHEWFLVHLGGQTESSMYRLFYDHPVIQRFHVNDMFLLTETITDLADNLELLNENDQNHADVFAYTLSDLENDFTVVITGSTDIHFEIFCPSWKKFQQALLLESDEYKEEEAVKEFLRGIYYSIASICIEQPETTICICEHTDKTENINASVFINGKYWSLRADTIEKLINFVLDEEGSFVDNFSKLSPETSLEVQIKNAAISISEAIVSIMEEISNYATKTGVDPEICITSINPPVFAKTNNGEPTDDNEEKVTHTAFMMSPELTNLPLTQLFDQIIQIDEQIQGKEATKTILSASIVRGATELVLTGEISNITDEINEFSDFIKLDQNARPFDFEVLKDVNEFSVMQNNKKEVDILKNMYTELDVNLQKEIQSAADIITFAPGQRKMLISFECDEHDNIASTDGYGVYIQEPSGEYPNTDSFNSDNLRTIFTKSALMKNSMIFIALMPDVPSSTNITKICAMHWNKGSWKSVSDRVLEQTLDSSNMLELLGVSPYEPIDFYQLEKM